MTLGVRVAGWLLLGLAGTAGIVAAAFVTIGVWMPVQIVDGLVIWTEEWDNGAVEATGTFVSDGAVLPDRLATLRCNREARLCRLAQTDVADGVLRLQTLEYGVAAWTADTIVIGRREACHTEVFTIRRDGMSGTLTPDGELGCYRSARPIHLTLSDGVALSRAYERSLKDWIFPAMWVALGLLWLVVVLRLWWVLRAAVTNVTLAVPPPRRRLR